MRPALFVLFFVAAIAAWCQPGFAQQTISGAIPTPLSAAGVTGGVSMIGQGGGGTLTVGTVGGPEMDIFTNNQPVNASLLAVSTSASSLSNILFNSSSTVFGAIGITQPGGPFFLNLSGGNNGTVENFNGPVFATTTTVLGTGTLNFNSGSTNVTATNFAGDGTIGLAPNTTLIGAVTTTAGADTGTLSLGGGSVLTGAVGGAIGLKAINVVGGSNTAGVSANISGAVDAFSFNLGTNTLNIGGALTIANQSAAGVINTTLASPTVFGNIRPLGTTLLGPTLDINVAVPSTALFPVGTQFNIVQTQTGTTQVGTSGSVLVIVKDPSNPLFTFSAVPPAGTVNGLVAITTTGIPLTVPIAPPPGVTLPPTTPLAAPVVPALLAVVPLAAVAPATAVTPLADLATVLAGINALSNPVVVVNALAQLAPSTPDLAAPLVTFQGTQQFQNGWLSRMDDVMCGQVSQRRPDEDTSSCQKNEPHSGWWAKAFGYFGDQGAEGPFPGYDSRILGTMIAYDAPILRDEPDGLETRAGLGIGYARSTIDGKTFDTNTDFNTYRATAYIDHEHGPWFVQGDVSFGWNDYSGARNISFPGLSRTANAGYSGQDYTAFATTGYHFLAEGFTITPLASLQYTHLNLNGYTETGAGSIDLKVNSQNYDFLESGLGVKVARPIGSSDGTYVPEGHFKWLHEINNPTLANTAAFTAGTPSFTTPGLKTADDTLNVGVGVTLLSCACSAKTWSVEAVYDFYWRTDNYSAQQGMIKLTARF